MRKKIKEIYNELNNGENAIKNNLQNNIISFDEYNMYCLLDNDLVKRYTEYIIDHLNNSSINKFNYNISELKPKTEEKIFCLKDENDYLSYSVPLKYRLETYNFFNMILPEFFNQNNQNYLVSINIKFYHIYVGGNCIILKGSNFDLYITLIYNETGENNVDFILHFKSMGKMEENLNIILQNNFFNYLGILL